MFKGSIESNEKGIIMELLEGKKVFITGGSRGIGKSICIMFAREGADIAFNYHKDEDAASQVVNSVKQYGRKCLSFKAPIDDLNAVTAMFKETSNVLGGLDVLVNNAGIKRDGLLIMMSDDTWNDVISVNLKGMFYCCRAAAKLMLRNKSGVIVNISSLTGEIGLAGQANYAASKGGVIAFTKAIAKELAAFGIRVNGVSPGFIETEMLSSVSRKILDTYKNSIPLQRVGSPDEVAATALFLASNLSTYITGEIIKVNGGLYM